MYSVSVIMAVHNNEKTLERAVESILNQSMYGYELILINDGSTDRSAQICDEYAKKEPLLIEVIHQKHLGLGIARNKGLFKSSGKYVYFADAADVFDNRMLQANVKLAEEKESEVVVFGFSSHNEKNGHKLEYHLPRMPILSDKDDFRNHFRNYHHFYPYTLFNKLYKRDYLFEKRIKFSNFPKREDAFFNLNVYNKLQSVAFNRGVYCHRQAPVTDFPVRYDSDVFGLQLQLAMNFETLIKNWGYEELYTDLIAEEYFKAAYFELNNVCAKETPFSFEQQVIRMESVLQEENIRRNLHNVILTSEKTSHLNRILLYFQKQNAKKAVESMSRINEVNQAVSKVSTMASLVRKLFTKR